MTTINETGSDQNVTNNERAFRAVFGMAILATVVASAVMTPLAMFSVTMIAVYLVMTAIVAIDPIYRLAHKISSVHRMPYNHHDAGKACA